MKTAGLVTWILTALIGSYLIVTWIANGGLRPRAGGQPSRFAPPLIFSHAGLAAAGLVVWASYLAAGTRVLAWACLAVLAVVVTLGATMFGLWYRAGNARRRGQHTQGPRHAAEDHFPPPAVLGHGLLAATTVVLVLVTALQATPGHRNTTVSTPPAGTHPTAAGTQPTVGGHPTVAAHETASAQPTPGKVAQPGDAAYSFLPNTADLRNPGAAAATLAPLIDWLTSDRTHRVILTGTTARSGTRAGQLTLSRNRAATIARLLTVAGVHPDQITTRGVGSYWPGYTPDHDTHGNLLPAAEANRTVIVHPAA